MRRKISLLLMTALAAMVLTACGGSAEYKDGTYEAESTPYESFDDASEDEGGNGYAVVKITIKDNVITDCEFTTYQLDGTVKDEEYGKQNGAVANQDFYNKAQRAVQASQNYADQLAEKGELSKVDAISGASISYDQFQEAVKLALKQAEK